MAEEKQRRSPAGVATEAAPPPATPLSVGEAPPRKPHFPNPPDPFNPDPATLRDQWRYAIRQYSRWYSQAWGTAILAGVSFFALGWFIKGSNPLPSRARDGDEDSGDSSSLVATGQ
ncbi:unnamed protein product [Spirodela intermedia]|uniref:Uncharacterized protein n=1 Tax=Spirodela intermedia TaxID=51605 RepID=A0A7I8KZ92_SPIIN|nr:unnamed protein product [Spirodela intermedia]